MVKPAASISPDPKARRARMELAAKASSANTENKNVFNPGDNLITSFPF